MDITICQHQNQTDNYLCSQRWRISTQSVKTRPGVDCCGSDHELLVAKFRLKLKKVEKTTRSFRYDLNQIPYDLEMLTRFTRLDLVDSVPEELWMDVHFWIGGGSDQNYAKEKEVQEGKVVV